MDAPQQIALDEVVLRHDLAPRLGQRDGDLVAQYAEIFDELPPIEINGENELIDGWHRVLAAQKIERAQISYVVVSTDGDDELRDRMYAANLRHGVQYSREQKRAYGIALHGRELYAKDIARLSGVGVSTVYRWTSELREQEKQERDLEIHRLRDDGLTQQEIADELRIAQSTVAEIIGDSQMRISDKEPESVAEPEIEVDETETIEGAESEIGQGPVKRPIEEEEAQAEAGSGPPSVESDESPADEQADASESEPESDADEASVEKNAAAPEAEPVAPQEIPDHILETARAVMVGFVETRPDAYVAKLEASAGEWMAITDDCLSSELERDLLTSAAAMCLWQEWMI